MTPARVAELRRRIADGEEPTVTPAELAMLLHALLTSRDVYARGEQSGIDHVKCVAKITDGKIDFSDVECEEVDVYP